MTQMDKLERLVAELKRRIEKYDSSGLDIERHFAVECEDILEYIDSLQEEFVSKELEECTSEIILEGTNFNKSWYAHPELAFKAGAKWQRQKDEHLIWQTSTANYEKGIDEGKQRMMKDAVVAAVNTYEEIGGEGYVEFVANIPVGQYKKEMLVKLIIIKDE